MSPRDVKLKGFYVSQLAGSALKNNHHNTSKADWFIPCVNTKINAPRDLVERDTTIPVTIRNKNN